MPINYDSLGITDYPQLCYPQTTGITPPTTSYPEYPSLVVPLRLKSYTPPRRTTQLQPQTTLPLTNRTMRTASGGTFVTTAIQELQKVTSEGYIDTPTITSGNFQLPNVQVDINEISYNTLNITYAELIEFFQEGLVNIVDDIPERVDPLWFRDPFGRIYNSPRILDFTAQYVEAVPGRVNFTMTLKV